MNMTGTHNNFNETPQDKIKQVSALLTKQKEKQ